MILGGGVPKNYSLQPEPALSQIFFLENIRGYDYDAQIVSSPVTDGSLSSCEPAEAVSWGKVNPDTYTTQTVSMQGDYSSYMPFIVRALVGKESAAQSAGAAAAVWEAGGAEGEAAGDDWRTMPGRWRG